VSPELSLELLNGNWAIASLALFVIGLAYLTHETISNHVHGSHWRDRLTVGMRVAFAVSTLSAGVFIRSIETWRWRRFGGDLDQAVLTIGSLIAILGFLCAIREISSRLFGIGPWVWTIVAMVVFNLVTLLSRLG
jgi:hypothetical protein